MSIGEQAVTAMSILLPPPIDAWGDAPRNDRNHRPRQLGRVIKLPARAEPVKTRAPTQVTLRNESLISVPVVATIPLSTLFQGPALEVDTMTWLGTILCVPIVAVCGTSVGPTQLPTDVRVTELRCEYLADPLGIDVVPPRLSWNG